jgi:mRNA interferase HigB
MILLGKRTLAEFAMSHAEAKPAIESWVAEVEAARWQKPQDIRDRFGRTVSFLADNRVIFDLKGNKFRLEVQIAYQIGIVTVKRIGTHAEYNRW